CWELPPLSEAPPAWLTDWAESVGGFQLNAKGDMVALPLDAERRFREMAGSTKATDLYSATLSWFYEPSARRKLSPRSSVSRHELAASLCQVDDRGKAQLAHRLVPDEPLPWAGVLWSDFENGGDLEPELQDTLRGVAD